MLVDKKVGPCEDCSKTKKPFKVDLPSLKKASRFGEAFAVVILKW